MKLRMRADLREAMGEGRTGEIKVIRSLIAAIDNAEAPASKPGQSTGHDVQFRSGSAEVARLELSAARIAEILLAEIEEREQAAAEMDRLGKPGHAQTLRTEAALARRYLEP